MFGLACLRERFRSFAIVPGVDLVMEATGFDAKLAGADLVITGEGRIDAQTAFGKTALGVARRAAAAGVPCVAVGGGVEPEGIAALAAVGAVAVPVVERPQSVEEAMAAGPAPLERCGERLARLVGVGLALAAPGKRQVRVPGMDRGRIVINGTFDDPPPDSRNPREYTGGDADRGGDPPAPEARRPRPDLGAIARTASPRPRPVRADGAGGALRNPPPRHPPGPGLGARPHDPLPEHR